MVSRRTLKIGIPINTFVLGDGLPGIDKYTYNLIHALQRQEGVEVIVFQEKYRENGPFDQFEISYFPILKELLGIKRPEGTRQTSPAGKEEMSVKKEMSDFSLFRREILKSICYLSRKVDVVHYPTHMESPLSLKFFQTVLTFHDLVPLVHPETSTEDIVRKFNRCVERLRYVDELITDSEFSKREMVDKMGIEPGRVTVCYPGVDQAFFISEAKEDVVQKYSEGSPYILFVGTLEPRKNVEAIVEALAGIERPELKLLLVGKEGWGIERIRTKVRDMGLNQRVVFLGYVPEEDLPFLYQGADVFVYPSFYEGFGIPILEAMAAGTPVVTSNVSSLPEVAGDAALYISPDNVREILEAIKGVLGNRQVRKELRVKGIKKAREFTWDKCARDALRVYWRVKKT
jgi:glycosyltransferase involved in cell wall biosynthesis